MKVRYYWTLVNVIDMQQGSKAKKADFFLVWNFLKIVKQKLFWLLLLILIQDSYIKELLQKTSWKRNLRRGFSQRTSRVLTYSYL